MTVAIIGSGIAVNVDARWSAAGRHNMAHMNRRVLPATLRTSSR
jgi:hypothetical protein